MDKKKQRKEALEEYRKRKKEVIDREIQEEEKHLREMEEQGW